MANPPCMSDDGNAAVFVGTMLQTGDAVALCDECLVPWASAVLYAMTGVDPAPFLAAVSDDPPTAEQIAAAEQAPAPPPADPFEDPPPPKRNRGRMSDVSRAAGMENDPAADESPPTKNLDSDAA